MSTTKEKSRSAATPRLQSNLAPLHTETIYSVPERDPRFNTGVIVKGHVTAGRVLVKNWKETFVRYLACEEEEGEAYLTAFTYGQDFLQHYEQHRSNKNFSGSVCAHFLHLDFDCAEDPADAIAEAQSVLRHCETQGANLDEVLACFSGNKGAHIYFPLPSCAVPSKDFGKICKSVVREITKDCQHIDLKIYDHQRVFRLPNTRHPGSGKLKVPYWASDFVGLGPLQILDQNEVRKVEVHIPDAAGEWLAPLWKAAANQIQKKEVPLPSRAQSSRTLSADTVDFIRHGATEGDRNISLYRAAYNLHELNVPRQTVDILLAPSARESGLPEAEIQRTLQSASKHAEPVRGRFRLYEACMSSKAFFDLVCEILTGADFPPEGDWAELEKHYSEHDFPPAGALDSTQFSKEEVVFLGELWLQTWKKLQTEEAKKSIHDPGALIEQLQVIQNAGILHTMYSNIPDPRPMGDPIFKNGPPPDTFAALIGGDGVGKSFLIMKSCVEYATGRGAEANPFGPFPGKRLKCLYVSYEENTRAVTRRLQAICNPLNIDYAELIQDGWLRFICRPREKLFMKTGPDARDIAGTTFLKRLEKDIIKEHLDLVFIDPFVKAVGVNNENDNMEVEAIGDRLQDLADRTECCICVAHHTSKEGRSSLQSTAARGASSLMGSARFAWNVIEDGEDPNIVIQESSKNTHGIKHVRAYYERMEDGALTSISREEMETRKKERREEIAQRDTIFFKDHIPKLVAFVQNNPEYEITRGGISNGQGAYMAALMKYLELNSRKDVLALYDLAVKNGEITEIQKRKNGRDYLVAGIKKAATTTPPLYM